MYSPPRILYILLDTLPDRVFTNGITLGLKNSIHINYIVDIKGQYFTGSVVIGEVDQLLVF